MALPFPRLSSTGQEASDLFSVRAIAHRGSSCRVLDIHLPGMSGVELHQQLSRSGHSVPAIFITGEESETTRRAATETGCVAYLTKPFLAEALMDALKKVFGSDAA
jgi:FixJ family two-component response regulator